MKNYKDTCKLILGNDIFEELQKFEIYKPESNTALNPEEIKIAMQIVPRAIISFLTKELVPMQVDGVKELELPFVEGGKILINKKGKDNYSGEIYQNSNKVYDYKFRSIPGIGLLLLSTFELYNMEDLKEIKQEQPKFDINVIQDIIDSRLKTYDLINSVVNNKLSMRQAREEFIEQKLNIILNNKVKEDMSEKPKKELKLKSFLDKKNKKKEGFEFAIEKSENATCGDCGQVLFDSENWHSGCICVSEDMNKKVTLKKTENGVNLKFAKSWDQENVKMLIDSIKKVTK